MPPSYNFGREFLHVQKCERPGTYVCVLAVLVNPLPDFILEAQHCVVPLGQQGLAEAWAALWLVAADEGRQDVSQHLTQGVMHLQDSQFGTSKRERGQHTSCSPAAYSGVGWVCKWEE